MEGKRKRILVFDDDFESMRDFKEYIEEELEWDVDLTANRSLLERLSHERFDLIIVDLMIRPASLDAISVHGNDRWFPQYGTLALYEHDYACCPKVDTDVCHKPPH